MDASAPLVDAGADRPGWGRGAWRVSGRPGRSRPPDRRSAPRARRRPRAGPPEAATTPAPTSSPPRPSTGQPRPGRPPARCTAPTCCPRSCPPPPGPSWSAGPRRGGRPARDVERADRRVELRDHAALPGGRGRCPVLHRPGRGPCGARPPLDPLGTGRFVAVTLADGKVHPPPTPAYDRSNPYSCVLTDGRLLIVSGTGTAIGGSGTPVEYLTRTAKNHDPAAGTWTPTGRLAASHLSLDRANQCLVALPDGGALIVAGSDQVNTYTDIVERWSPSTNRSTRTAPLPISARPHHHAAGHRHRAGRRRRERERCPRRHLHLRPRLRLMEPRRHHDQTAHRARPVLIPDGRLLVIDGAADGSCEIFDSSRSPSRSTTSTTAHSTSTPASPTSRNSTRYSPSSRQTELPRPADTRGTARRSSGHEAAPARVLIELHRPRSASR